jgi:hypothetical protein
MVQSSPVRLSKNRSVKENVPGAEYGSQLVISESARMVIVPPYCGVPSESHQFPAAVVVVAVVVVTGAVVFVVVVVVVVAVVVVVVDEVFVPQDASNMAATSKKLKPNQINLFFVFLTPI